MAEPSPTAFPPPFAESLPAPCPWRTALALLAGLLFASGLAAIWYLLGQPTYGLAALLHPLADVGHGLAIALLCRWLQEQHALGAGRAGLAGLRAEPVDPLSWAVRARARCREQEPVADQAADYRGKYDACHTHWALELRRRWRFPYLLAAALVLPCTMATLLSLTPESAKTMNALELALPMLVGCAEGLGLAFAFLLLEKPWEMVLLEWKDAAAACDVAARRQEEEESQKAEEAQRREEEERQKAEAAQRLEEEKRLAGEDKRRREKERERTEEAEGRPDDDHGLGRPTAKKASSAILTGTNSNGTQDLVETTLTTSNASGWTEVPPDDNDMEPEG